MKQKNILVITLSNIGDVIVTTPVIAALKTQFPQSNMTVVCGPRTLTILEGSRMIDEIVVYNKRQSLFEKIQFIQKLRKKKYDIVVDLRHTAIPYLVSAKKTSPAIRWKNKLPLHKKHLLILERMKLSTRVEKPFDFFNEAEADKAFEILKTRGVSESQPSIVIAPFAASQLKTWTLEGFKELIQKLLAATSETILLVGGEREKPLIEPLLSLHPSRVISLAGETTLRELSAIVNRSVLLIANDSSVLHLGYEMKRPTVAVFGPTDPALSAREGIQFRVARNVIPCSPCEKSQCQIERRKCLDDLSSETVFQSCQELLNAARPVS